MHVAPGRVYPRHRDIRPRHTSYSCGIRADSTLQCWSINDNEYLDVPVGEFVQVSHTAGPSCALDTEGSIVCWNPAVAVRAALHLNDNH